MKKLLASALVLTGCMVAFSAPAYAAFFSGSDRGDAAAAGSAALEHRGAIKDVNREDVKNFMHDRRSPGDESATQKRDWAKGEFKQAYTHPTGAMEREMGIAGKGMNKEVDLYQQSQERRHPAPAPTPEPAAEPSMRDRAQSMSREQKADFVKENRKEIWENRGDVRGHGEEVREGAREGAAKAKSWF